MKQRERKFGGGDQSRKWFPLRCVCVTFGSQAEACKMYSLMCDIIYEEPQSNKTKHSIKTKKNNTRLLHHFIKYYCIHTVGVQLQKGRAIVCLKIALGFYIYSTRVMLCYTATTQLFFSQQQTCSFSLWLLDYCMWYSALWDTLKGHRVQSGCAPQSTAMENRREEASPEYHLTNLRRVMWAVWCWSSWIARRHSSALERDKNSPHLSLLHWLAVQAMGW